MPNQPSPPPFLTQYALRASTETMLLKKTSSRRKKIKKGLMFVVIILIMMMIIWPLTHAGKRNFKVNLASTVNNSSTEQIAMMMPYLHGLDAQQQAYNVRAHQATQDNQERVTLETVSGDITLKEHGLITLKANQGIYHIPQEILHLKDSILLTMEDGSQLTTEIAEVNLAQKIIQSNNHVTLKNQMGILQANTMIVHGTNNVIIFKGNVHLHTTPSSKH